MKKLLIFLFILLACTLCYAEKRSGNYKSSVLLVDTLDKGRYQVIIESKDEVRFLLCKEYETAFNCYYAIALFGKTEMYCDLTERIPSVIKSLKEQGHKVKVIEDSTRGGYHGIVYNID